MKMLDILTLIFGLYATAYALAALFVILLIISLIMLLFGMNIYNIAAFWALCIGLPLFWKYVHDKEEKEQKEKREQAKSQSNFDTAEDSKYMAKSGTNSKTDTPIVERESEKETKEETEEGESLFFIEVRKSH